jgi:hypothetical protein
VVAKGVTFLQDPSERPYGVEAVMRDNSGTWLVLVERRPFTPEDLASAAAEADLRGRDQRNGRYGSTGMWSGRTPAGRDSKCNRHTPVGPYRALLHAGSTVA